MNRQMLVWLRTLVALLLFAGLMVACSAPQEPAAEDEPAAEEEAPVDEEMTEEEAPAEEEMTDEEMTEEEAPADEEMTEEEGSVEGGDLLADVQERGVLRVSTDSNYAPQSFLNPDGTWEGFDIDVARAVAEELGVEVEFLDISFDVVTAGSWNDRWDANIGSMTVTPARAEVLIFTTPYYYTPAAFAVHEDSAAAEISDLEGATVGLGAATTYLDYLNGTLTLTGEEIVIEAPEGATAQVYDTDLLALQDLALGDGTRLDAAITALPTIQNAIDNGEALKVVGDPVYYEALAVALDRESSLDSTSLAEEISGIVEELRANGTLTELSLEYYGVDIATKVE